MSDNLPLVQELLNLRAVDRVRNCSRCGQLARSSLQLRVVGNRVAICTKCLHALLRISIFRAPTAVE